MRSSPFLLSAILIAGLALAAYVGFRLGREQSAPALPATAPATTKSEAKVDPKTGRKVLYWHDPMSPGHRFDRPGKSPFMDMDLVPVYEDEVGEGGSVIVSPRIAQNLGLRTALARRAQAFATIEGVGTLVEDERSVHVLQSRVNGYVESLRVRAALDPVTAGQAVAVIFAPEWAAAQDEYLALRRLRADAALVEAARRRLALLSIPEDLIASAEAADAAQVRFTLRAPSSGVVSELSVREGAMVTPGMTLLRVVDLRRVWLHVEVPEAAARYVERGLRVAVRPVGFADRVIEGRVAAVLPQVSPDTRTLRVRVELPNADLALRPGMVATATLSPAAPTAAVLVPAAAVIPTGRRTVVIIKTESGGFRPVEIETGRDLGDEVEIRRGLEAGQTVVVSGQFLLDSEASLKSGLARLDTAPPPSGKSAEPPPLREHRGEGTVKAIGTGEITIAHEPIPSLKWPAMAMPIRYRGGALPAGLASGDRVTFTLIEDADGDMVIVRVEPRHDHGDRR